MKYGTKKANGLEMPMWAAIRRMDAGGEWISPDEIHIQQVDVDNAVNHIAKMAPNSHKKNPVLRIAPVVVVEVVEHTFK